jgi:hypothetical protein
MLSVFAIRIVPVEPIVLLPKVVLMLLKTIRMMVIVSLGFLWTLLREETLGLGRLMFIG